MGSLPSEFPAFWREMSLSYEHFSNLSYITKVSGRDKIMWGLIYMLIFTIL